MNYAELLKVEARLVVPHDTQFVFLEKISVMIRDALARGQPVSIMLDPAGSPEKPGKCIDVYFYTMDPRELYFDLRDRYKGYLTSVPNRVTADFGADRPVRDAIALALKESIEGERQIRPVYLIPSEHQEDFWEAGERYSLYTHNMH